MRKLINFAAFQLGWFAAVLGPGHGMPWLGLVVVPLVLLLNLCLSADWRGELRSATGGALLGFVFDTAMAWVGVFRPVPFLWPAPFSPPWMVMLWVNQMTTMNSCLAWLRGRYALGAAFGAIGGPLAYLGGAKLGAAAIPSPAGMIILAMGWALAFPALLWLARAEPPESG